MKKCYFFLLAYIFSIIFIYAQKHVEIVIKRTIIFICLISLNMTLAIAENYLTSYGQYITIEEYNYLLQNKENFEKKDSAESLPLIYHNIYNLTFLNVSDYIVLYKDQSGKLLCNINERNYIVNNYIENTNQILFDLYSFYANSDDINYEDSIILKFVDNQTYEVISKEKKFFNSKKMICVATPPAIPLEYAILNDSKVRVRTENNLACDTWGYVNKSDLVIIKDRSSEKFKIDEESWYWYKIESEFLPDGWVYGKYLDIITKEEYDKKLKSKNNTQPEEIKLSKLEIIENIYNVIAALKGDANRNKKDNKNVVYKDSKKIYVYYGNKYEGTINTLEITDNKYSYIHGIEIGMSKSKLLELLGTPDEQQNDNIIYKENYGKLFKYTLTLHFNNNLLGKIELKREQL